MKEGIVPEETKEIPEVKPEPEKVPRKDCIVKLGIGRSVTKSNPVRTK